VSNVPDVTNDDPNTNPVTLKFEDSPGQPFPLTWQTTGPGTTGPLYPDVDFLQTIKWTANFTTFVAAQTKDTEGGGNNTVWAEDSQTWGIDTTNRLTKAQPKYAANGTTITGFNLTWSNPNPGNVAIGKGWTPITKPTAIDRSRPISNNYADTVRSASPAE